MGNAASSNANLMPNSKLATEIDRIASNYILSQNFNDMNKLSEKGHCDKLVILTAKIISNNLQPLEQKKVVERIKGNDINIIKGQTGGEEEDCVKIAKYYVKIAHLYAAIMKTINPVIISTDENGKLKKY